MALKVVVGSIALGAVLDWLLARTRFSVARAFCRLHQGTSREWANAYILALALVWMILGAASLGSWVDHTGPVSSRPVGAVLGGFISGLALSVLGACTLSLAFDAARFSRRAVVALGAWGLGVAAGITGPVGSLVGRIQDVSPAGLMDAGLAELVGLPQWLVLIVFGGGVFGWLLRVPVTVSPGGMEWPRQGAGLAMVVSLGWMLAFAGGEFGGLNGVTAVRDLVAGLAGTGWSFGPSLLAAAGLLGFGVVRGIAARRRPGGTIATVGPRGGDGKELAKVAVAGFVLGIGSALAGGCPAAHALFGIGFLRLDSMVFVAALWCGGRITGFVRRKE